MAFLIQQLGEVKAPPAVRRVLRDEGMHILPILPPKQTWQMKMTRAALMPKAQREKQRALALAQQKQRQDFFAAKKEAQRLKQEKQQAFVLAKQEAQRVKQAKQQAFVLAKQEAERQKIAQQQALPLTKQERQHAFILEKERQAQVAELEKLKARHAFQLAKRQPAAEVLDPDAFLTQQQQGAFYYEPQSSQPQYYETPQYAQQTTMPYQQEVYQEFVADYQPSYEDTARERALRLFETPQRKYAADLPENDGYAFEQPIEQAYKESFPATKPKDEYVDEYQLMTDPYTSFEQDEQSEEFQGFRGFQSSLHDVNDGQLQINYKSLGIAVALTAGIWYLLKKK